MPFKVALASSLIYALGGTAFPQQTMIALKPYPKAFANPLKGFRKDIPRNAGPGNDLGFVYGGVYRHYIAWNLLEDKASDGVDKIQAWCDKAWAGVEDHNAKIIPVVYTIYRNGANAPDEKYYPSDWVESADRYAKMIRKLGQAWNNDPRVAWVDAGLVGPWGEQAGLSKDLEKVMCEEFRAAFPDKHVLFRYGKTCSGYGFGIYWWSWGCPKQAADAALAVAKWKTPAVISGEISYDYCPPVHKTPDEDLSDSSAVDRLIELARWMHSSATGWLASYSPGPATDRGAERFQMASGYQLVIDTVRYTSSPKPGDSLSVEFGVTNLGAAQFLYPWPVEVSLCDPATRKPAWRALFKDVDIRSWYPGDAWDYDAVAGQYGSHKYRVPPLKYRAGGKFKLPADLPAKEYILALAILDPAGMLPCARFAIANYWNGGRHPIGRIGVGVPVPSAGIAPGEFDDLKSDRTLHYSLTRNVPIRPHSGAGTASGSLAFRYDGNALSVDGPAELCIRDARGTARMRLRLAGTGTVDLSRLPSGIYRVSLARDGITGQGTFVRTR